MDERLLETLPNYLEEENLETPVLGLVRQLLHLQSELSQRMQQRFQRLLPIDELLSDRWQRARHLGFGDGTSIYHNSYVYGEVKVGAHTWIGPFTILDGTGGLEIGDYCAISVGVHIYTHDAVKWALSGGREPYEYVPVKIGNNCFLGAGAVVLRGVTIGERCVVGAGAVVTKDVPDASIVAGVPARLIGTVRVSMDGKIALEYHNLPLS